MSPVRAPSKLSHRTVSEIFPKAWLGGVITASSAGEWWGNSNDALGDTYGVIGITDAQSALLAALRRAGDESIPSITDLDAAMPSARTLMVFRSTDTSNDPPTGLLTFSLDILRGTTSGRIEEMRIHLRSAWVAPVRRQQGYGKHLVAHCLNYIELRLATVCGFRVAAEGLRVVVSGQATSPGGKRLVVQTYRHFILMKEGNDEHLIVSTSTWGIADAQLRDVPEAGQSLATVD